MISGMSLFQVYGAMAKHASEAQRVSAHNVANADQPGFKASKVETFEAYLARAAQDPAQSALPADFKAHLTDAPTAPNGNSVSLEREIFQSAQAAGQHDLALTVYTKSLDLLRTAIGKRV